MAISAGSRLGPFETTPPLESYIGSAFCWDPSAGDERFTELLTRIGVARGEIWDADAS